MNRPVKIGLIVVLSLGGFVIALVIFALIAVQTPWFRNTVREKIVSEIEKTTGAKAEIGNFSMNVGTGQAEIDHLVLHGSESAGQPPLFRARSVAVKIDRQALLHRHLVIDSLVVKKPQVFYEVKKDGASNMPANNKPAQTPEQAGGKTPLENLVDLAIGHFRASNGTVIYQNNENDFHLTGHDVQVRLNYDPRQPGYTGTVSMSPADISRGVGAGLPVSLDAKVAITPTQVRIVSARLNSPGSHAEISGTLTSPGSQVPAAK